ncbi:6362_t:CDS:2 [Paraglomus brasilianum]|uniref:6362_t:CDS:1 n=1 Tax=Paraglomus brasilianum TaxID=144538 RepID=A0A9N9BTF1_9GLOM|nr:6362_t:CDS:2 [Paraglomus brasilianum]
MYTPIRILTAIIALMALAMLVRAVPQGTGIVSGLNTLPLTQPAIQSPSDTAAPGNTQQPQNPTQPTPAPSPPTQSSPPPPSPPPPPPAQSTPVPPAQPSPPPAQPAASQPSTQPAAQPSAQPSGQPSAQSQNAPQQTASPTSTLTLTLGDVVTVTSTSTSFPPEPTETCIASGVGGAVTCNDPNSYCDRLSNTCSPKNANGLSCTAGDECLSGFCNNNVCAESSSSKPTDENSNSSLGTKIGVVVGVIFGTAAFVGIFVCCIRLVYNRRQRKLYSYETESDAYSDGVSITENRRPSYPFAGGAAAFSSANPPFAARNVARSAVTDTSSDYNPRPTYNAAVPAPIPPSMQYRGQGGSDIRSRDVNTSRTVQPGPLYPGPSQITAANYQYANNMSSLGAPIPSQPPVAQRSYNQPPPTQPPAMSFIPKPDRVYSPRPAAALPPADSISANEVVGSVSNNATRSPIAAIGAGVAGNNLQAPDARQSNASSDKGVQIVYRVANNKQAEDAHNRLFEAARDMNERQAGNANNEQRDNASAALDQTYLGIGDLVPHGDFEEKTGRKGGRYTMASMYTNTTSIYSTYSRDSSMTNFGLRPPGNASASSSSVAAADVPDSPTLSYTGFYEANIAQADSSNQINVPVTTDATNRTTEGYQFGQDGAQTYSGSFEADLAAIQQFTKKHDI